MTKNIDSGRADDAHGQRPRRPELEIAPGETQMWRFANIGADIWYRVYFGGRPFHVIAEDANPVGEVWQAKRLLLPPGKRYDVLVQGPKPGDLRARDARVLDREGGRQLPEADPGDASPRPAIRSSPRRCRGAWDRCPTCPRARSTAGATSSSRRATNGNQFFINGKQFSHHRIDVHTELGQTEDWVIRNVSDELHPFHIHVNDFEVISINGRPYDARSLQDTVPLPVHGEVVIRQRFARFTGKFVYHCHILAHEDHGMMGVIKVSGLEARAPPTGTPFTATTWRTEHGIPCETRFVPRAPPLPRARGLDPRECWRSPRPPRRPPTPSTTPARRRAGPSPPGSPRRPSTSTGRRVTEMLAQRLRPGTRRPGHGDDRGHRRHLDPGERRRSGVSP